MKNKTYPNFLQNGKECHVNGLEFTAKQIFKIYSDIHELREDLQHKYEKSVKNLQRISYRTFAAKCAFSYAKANTIEFTRFADVDADLMYRFRDMALDDRIKLKKEQREAEFEHINYTKPQYMSIRQEDDRWLKIKEWVWNTCYDQLGKLEGEHPRDYEKRIYQIPVRVFPNTVGWGNGKTYIVSIPQFNLEKEFL